MITLHKILVACLSLVTLALAPAGTASAQVRVTAATPSSAYQGTVALDVVVGGSGFDPGSKVDYFVSGTANPGGISVKKVTFRNSKELVTTIDVEQAADIASFDIQVTTASGRKGKGTSLFSVKSRATDIDVAFMNISSSVWGEPNTASVLGVHVNPDGTATADVPLWKGSSVYHGSLAWDPGGNWMAWAQYIDRKGTRAIVVASQGSDPIPVLTFPHNGITRRNGTDTIAWGRGCDGRSVIVFLGDQSWSYLDALFVFDPFAASPQARLLYDIRNGPGGSPSRGQGIAFSPYGHFLAFVEQDGEGRDHIVALPVTCLPGDTLPIAAGPTQVLFPVRSADGVDGGRAGTVGLDWSADGVRLAASVMPLLVWTSGSQTWGTGRIATGLLNYGVLQSGAVEQVSAAGPDLKVVTFGPVAGEADYSDVLPAWGPSSSTMACDRMVFNRSGSLMLLDVPRPGFTPAECAVPAPSNISGKLINGLDWK